MLVCPLTCLRESDIDKESEWLFVSGNGNQGDQICRSLLTRRDLPGAYTINELNFNLKMVV